MYDRRIFFLGSIIVWPLIQLEPKFPTPEVLKDKKKTWGSPLKYLNAGVMVGPAGLIRRMIALVYQSDCWDDQYVYSLAFLDPVVWWVDAANGMPRVASTRHTPKELVPKGAKPLIGIDYTAHLMVTLSRVQRSWLKVNEGNRSITYRPTKESPLIMHENGLRQNATPLDLYSCDFGYQRFFKTRDECNATNYWSKI